MVMTTDLTAFCYIPFQYFQKIFCRLDKNRICMSTNQ